MVRTSSPEVAARRGHDLLDRILAGTRASPVTHVEDVPTRPGRTAEWPDWAPGLLVDRVSDVLECLPEGVQPAPTLGLGGDSAFVRGLIRHQDRFSAASRSR